MQMEAETKHRTLKAQNTHAYTKNRTEAKHRYLNAKVSVNALNDDWTADCGLAK